MKLKTILLLAAIAVFPLMVTAQSNDSVSPKVLRFVEQRAQFEGGDEAFLNFFNQNLIYPEIAQKQGIDGGIQVEFIIRKNGDVDNIKIVKTITAKSQKENKGIKALEKEAIRVVQAMQGKWQPAMRNDEKVDSYFIIPFSFVLKR